MISFTFETEEKAAEAAKNLYWGIFESYLDSGETLKFVVNCQELLTIIHKSGLLEAIYDTKNKPAMEHIAEMFGYLYEVISEEDFEEYKGRLSLLKNVKGLIEEIAELDFMN